MSKDKKELAQEKEARKQITERLEAALSDLKDALGEKKFASRVKKAVKILSKDVIVKMDENDEYEETINEEGIHTEVLSEEIKPVKKTAAPKKTAAKKASPAPARKAPAKKAATPKKAAAPVPATAKAKK